MELGHLSLEQRREVIGYASRGERHPDPELRPVVVEVARRRLMMDRWLRWGILVIGVLWAAEIAFWIATRPPLESMLVSLLGLALVTAAIINFYRGRPRLRLAIEVNSPRL